MSDYDFDERQAFVGDVVQCNAAERKCYDQDYLPLMKLIGSNHGHDHVALHNLKLWSSLKARMELRTRRLNMSKLSKLDLERSRVGSFRPFPRAG